MNELWKYAIVAIVCLLIGFTMGYLGDFPNQITFDATPRLIQFANETTNQMIKISYMSLNLTKEECPV